MCKANNEFKATHEAREWQRRRIQRERILRRRNIVVRWLIGLSAFYFGMHAVAYTVRVALEH